MGQVDDDNVPEIGNRRPTTVTEFHTRGSTFITIMYDYVFNEERKNGLT